MPLTTAAAKPRPGDADRSRHSMPHAAPDGPAAHDPGDPRRDRLIERVDIDTLQGPVLLELGVGWCGHCRAARPAIDAALAAHPRVRHLTVEDGRGRRLGRSFAVTLWPTLVFLIDGRELERLVRPTDAGTVAQALARIDPAR